MRTKCIIGEALKVKSQKYDKLSLKLVQKALKWPLQRAEASPEQSSRQSARPSVYQGGQNLKLSTKAIVFKRENLLIGGGSKHVDWGRLASPPPLMQALAVCKFSKFFPEKHAPVTALEWFLVLKLIKINSAEKNYD